MAILSIKSKLHIMLLSISALSIALVATLNYLTSQTALRASVLDHLTSISASRADAMEQYLLGIASEVAVLAASADFGTMSTGFASAVETLADTELTGEQLAALERLYREGFIPRLDAMVEGTPEFSTLFPASNAGRYLQFHYIAADPNREGDGKQLDDPHDGSGYSALHAEYHPVLRQITEGFNYYNLYLIDIETGRIVYTTAKEVTFATNLLDGPHAQSNLAHLFRGVRRNPDRGAVQFTDFDNYRGSHGEPAMFVAAPVFVRGRPVSVLAIQESTEDLNRVMTGGGQWVRDGLGETGETVLVGPDFTLRSASRFLIENPEAYAADQRSIATPQRAIENILALNSPILSQEFRAEATELALRGQSGTGVITDYRGRETLSSWAPLKVKGLDWAIVGKVDLDEAYAPINELARTTLVQTAIILVAVTLIVMLLAGSLVNPIHELIARIRRFGEGEMNVEFTDHRNDEIGELANSFRELVDRAVAQDQTIEESAKRNERLLANLLPRRLAERAQRGEATEVETIADVSVVFAEIRGLVECAAEKSPEESLTVLRQIVRTADEIGRERGVERIKTMGDTYMAAVGLSTAQLDHMRQALEFARELDVAIQQIGNEQGVRLSLAAGISGGSVMADVVQGDELLFHLWGEAVIQADQACDHATDGQIVVTEPVHRKLADTYEFEPLEGVSSTSLWCLRGD